MTYCVRHGGRLELFCCKPASQSAVNGGDRADDYHKPLTPNLADSAGP